VISDEFTDAAASMSICDDDAIAAIAVKEVEETMLTQRKAYQQAVADNNEEAFCAVISHTWHLCSQNRGSAHQEIIELPYKSADAVLIPTLSSLQLTAHSPPHRDSWHFFLKKCFAMLCRMLHIVRMCFRQC
jgi:hypothetical protein